MEKTIEKYCSAIGEFVWHSLTLDPNITRDSNRHYDCVIECIKRRSMIPITKILEVASYAHITGYKLRQELNAEVTLFDISASALKLGKKKAAECGYSYVNELVAGDFHHLPFDDCSFNLVYISSAIHHTKQYPKVVRELQRVLTPNGLLIILNEPYEREACFYRFRCNRSNSYTAFEQRLADIGLICTIAEPHPGSRDEALFGMVENQQIPLKKFLSIFTEECEIAEIKTTYETRMGIVERQWMEWADESKLSTALLQSRIEKNLTDKIELAKKALDNVAMGLGFGVPDTKEIQKMGRDIALKLHSCPENKKSWAYKQHLSELFGGSLFIVGHKKSHLQSHRSKVVHRSLETYPKMDGVRMCFTNKTSFFLNQKCSLMPLLSRENSEIISEFFPEENWVVQKQNNGLYTLVPISSTAKVILPSSEKKYLIFLRINFSLPDKNCFYRFKISNNSKLIYDYAVFREDAILYRAVVSSFGKSSCALSCTVTNLDQRCIKKDYLPNVVKIYYAGIFKLHEQV